MRKITKHTPETEIFKELAKRLVKIRKAKCYTQTELANEAGLGVATLRRIESGQDCNLGTWIKLLKTLEMTYVINQMLPETFDSPMAEVLAGKPRKRRRTSIVGFKWGDEIE